MKAEQLAEAIAILTLLAQNYAHEPPQPEHTFMPECTSCLAFRARAWLKETTK